MKKKFVLVIAITSIVLFKCGKNNDQPNHSPHTPVSLPTPPAALVSDPVGFWNESLLHAIRADKTPPPLASRAMAMMNLAMFDTINSITPRYVSYRPNLRLNPTASAPVGAVTAAHRVLVGLFPTHKAAFDQQLTLFLGSVPESRAKSEGIFQGETIANLMLDARKGDTAVSPAPVRPPLPGVWRPTPPQNAEFLLSGWGKILPFGIENGAQFRRTINPPPLNSPPYLAALEETKRLGGRVGSARTPEQTIIAEFWSDKGGTVTPPGHWIQIGRNVSKGINADMLDRSRFFSLLSMSLADAAIACWDMKAFAYNWRPITAIHARGDVAWLPLLETPPFPDYVSGHSTFSGAASRMLSLMMGRDNVAFSIGSDELPGVVRRFNRFSEAASEAGRSRIYGGIHFEFANRDGLRLGNEVAEAIFRRYLRPLR
jgi:hypothetical protein